MELLASKLLFREAIWWLSILNHLLGSIVMMGEKEGCASRRTWCRGENEREIIDAMFMTNSSVAVLKGVSLRAFSCTLRSVVWSFYFKGRKQGIEGCAFGLSRKFRYCRVVGCFNDQSFLPCKDGHQSYMAGIWCFLDYSNNDGNLPEYSLSLVFVVVAATVSGIKPRAT